MLLLGGSPAQQASFEELLAEQQDPASSNYRHWLTPREFGEQFGPAPRDVETISAWLRGHGFSVNAVAQGRRFIEFSGTAAQVAEAFHTEINSYVVDGKPYWANATDPFIPAALAPVVSRVLPRCTISRGVRCIALVTRTSFASTNDEGGGHSGIQPQQRGSRPRPLRFCDHLQCAATVERGARIGSWPRPSPSPRAARSSTRRCQRFSNPLRDSLMKPPQIIRQRPPTPGIVCRRRG
jgi:hypothetical protein